MDERTITDMTRMAKAVNALAAHPGFTLIELLVVIAIIGMLASVVLASVDSARGKGRDARRVLDLKQVQNALELYANDHNGQYPASVSGTGPCGRSYCLSSISSSLAPTYMGAIPQDPSHGNTTTDYLYCSNGGNYTLLAYRENNHWCSESIDGAAQPCWVLSSYPQC